MRRAARRVASVGDRGAGSIAVLAIVAVVFAVALSVLPVAAVLAARQQSAGAADAAALAAADAAIGLRPGPPCTRASTVAEANGSELVDCVIDGVVATVRVSARSGLVTVAATATAGPPGLAEGAPPRPD